ncbi:MAG: HTTM domain-containing protein [Rubripirellula sp.]
MSALLRSSSDWFKGYFEAWDQFWFTPRLPHTMSVIRIVTGVMLLYSHLVLATDLGSFLGNNAWMNNEVARGLHDGAFGFTDYGRSYLWSIENPLLLWVHHGVTLFVTACFAVGFLTRFTAPAAWFLQLMYLHRLTGALFGFDQIVTYSAMYLMFAPCGSSLSIDAWLRRRLGTRLEGNRKLRWMFPAATPSVSANILTRVFQIHLCVIYLFGGLAKARGESWWNGTAVWYSVGNYEYQSLDMTWIANYPKFFSAMTHATLFWEIFYCALVWPKRTRPIALGIAVAVHAGIAGFLGMITFGLMMIAANMVFVTPEFLLRIVGRSEPESEVQREDASAENSALVEEPAAVAFQAEVEEELDEEEFSLEDLGLEDIGLDSNASGILQHDPDASASGILDNVAQREAALARREQRLRDASARLRDKKERLNANLEKYGDRVERLKQREAKIKELVERRREKKKDKDDGDSGQ